MNPDEILSRVKINYKTRVKLSEGDTTAPTYKVEVITVPELDLSALTYEERHFIVIEILEGRVQI